MPPRWLWCISRPESFTFCGRWASCIGAPQTMTASVLGEDWPALRGETYTEPAPRSPGRITALGCREGGQSWTWSSAAGWDVAFLCHRAWGIGGPACRLCRWAGQPVLTTLHYCVTLGGVTCPRSRCQHNPLCSWTCPHPHPTPGGDLGLSQPRPRLPCVHCSCLVVSVALLWPPRTVCPRPPARLCARTRLLSVLLLFHVSLAGPLPGSLQPGNEEVRSVSGKQAGVSAE